MTLNNIRAEVAVVVDFTMVDIAVVDDGKSSTRLVFDIIQLTNSKSHH